MKKDLDARSIPGALRGAYRAAIRAGWTVTMTGSNHIKWQPPSGPPVFGSKTPTDHRSTANILATLRKAGLDPGLASRHPRIRARRGVIQ